MGYIPPVKDDQMVIYGNRQPLHLQLIYTTPSTQKVSFLHALPHLPSTNLIQHRSFHQKIEKGNIEEKMKEIEQQITGKGTMIDIKA